MNAAHREVPQFILYGEHAAAQLAEPVHIELIETRSRIHDWHIASHIHRGLFQVLFLMAGRVHAEVGGVVHDCEGPAVLTIHPSLVHGFAFSEEAQGYVLTIAEHIVFSGADSHADLFGALFVQPLALSLAALPEGCARLEALLQNLLAESAWPRIGHTLMLEWLARSALLLLVRVHAAHRVADQSRRGEFELFSRFRGLVEEHFREQWQVGRYADLLCVTPTRLNRLCLALAGQSAFDLTQARLMLEARRKLTYVPATIASIAYELGFQDPAYFSRLFKRQVGMTPKQFRRQAGDDPAARR